MAKYIYTISFFGPGYGRFGFEEIIMRSRESNGIDTDLKL